MALNDPDAGSRVRQPRAVVTANGVRLDGWTLIEVANNSHATSDTFRIQFPLYRMPAGMDLAFWLQDATDVEVAVKVGLLQPDGSLGALTQLIVGPIDRPETALMKGVLTVTGRDYSGALIETILESVDTNMTSSEIAQKIVSNHEALSGQITPTTQKIGAFYNNQYAQLRINMSEWDALMRLAQFEGFIVLMLGKTLYFGPRPDTDNADPYILKVTMPGTPGPPLRSNMVDLTLSRSLTFARDIKVQVLSENHMTGVSVKASAQSVNTVRAGRGGNKVPAQQFVYKDKPNLTQDQAQQRANAILYQMSQQERIADFVMPGDPTLTVQTVVQITGTGAADQRYYVDRLEHELVVTRSGKPGYTLRGRLKNHDTAWQLQP